jgi:hypothetical protein
MHLVCYLYEDYHDAGHLNVMNIKADFDIKFFSALPVAAYESHRTGTKVKDSRK